MAIVRKIEKINLEKDSKHTEVQASYCIMNEQDRKCLQIDTYGSTERQMQGKKSQSIRLSPEAIQTLLEIIKENNLAE